MSSDAYKYIPYRRKPDIVPATNIAYYRGKETERKGKGEEGEESGDRWEMVESKFDSVPWISK